MSLLSSLCNLFILPVSSLPLFLPFSLVLPLSYTFVYPSPRSILLFAYVFIYLFIYLLRAGRPRGRILSAGRVVNFLFSASFRPALGLTQPPMKWTTGALSSGVKRPGREADHSPPASA
jgi:hypothetical protein